MTVPLAPPVTIAQGAVPEGRVADFLTGKHVRDTPEEYVRQNLEKALVRQYKYPATDCEPEFAIKVGSSRKRVDVVVFDIDDARQADQPLPKSCSTRNTSSSGSNGFFI